MMEVVPENGKTGSTKLPPNGLVRSQTIRPPLRRSGTEAFSEQHTSRRRRSSLRSDKGDATDSFHSVGNVTSSAHSWFLPESRFMLIWNLLRGFMVFYYSFAMPMRIGIELKWYFPLEAIEFLFYIFHLADIFVLFSAPFHRDGIFVHQKKIIAKHYRMKAFWFDIVGAFPWEIIVAIVSAAVDDYGTYDKVYSYPFLLKWVSRCWFKIQYILETIKIQTQVSPGSMRLFELTVLLLLTWHWIGLAYWGTSRNYPIDYFPTEAELDGSWLPNYQYMNAPLLQQYCQALFWAVNMTIGIGYDVRPQTPFQVAATISAIIIGVSIYAFIIGSAGSAMTSMDAMKNKKNEKLEEIDAYLRTRRVQSDVKRQIKNYYQYIWAANVNSDTENEIMGTLPAALRDKLLVCINKSMVRKVNIFRGFDDEQIGIIISSLERLVTLPGEYVYEEGEVGESMYFLLKGDAQLLQGSGKHAKLIEVVSEGAYFGEESLGANVSRVFSVKGMTYCDLLVLSKESYEKLNSSCPDFERAIQSAAANTLKDHRKESFSASPLSPGAKSALNSVKNLIKAAKVTPTVQRRRPNRAMNEASPSTDIQQLSKSIHQVLNVVMDLQERIRKIEGRIGSSSRTTDNKMLY